MAEIIDFCSIRSRAAPNGRQKAVSLAQHPEDWILLSPTAFEKVSGVRISKEELMDVREIIYEIRAKAKAKA